MAYHVEGTIAEIGMEEQVQKNGKTVRRNWFSIKPSSAFIRKEGDLEKVLVVSEEDTEFLMQKDVEKWHFVIERADAHTFLLAKINHVTIKIIFPKGWNLNFPSNEIGSGFSICFK